MPYRAAPPRDPEPPARPSEVIAIRRYGWVWIGAIAAVAAGLSAVGIFGYQRSLLSCTRTSAGGEAECALVTERRSGVQREPIDARAYSVKVQDALIGDEGMKPHLGVHPSAGGVRWFQLRGRNDVVARSFAAFIASTEAGRYEEELEASRAIAFGLPASGVLLVLLLLAMEVKQRIAVFPETEELRISKESFLRGASERVFRLDEIDGVDTEQEGDGEIYAAVLVCGERRERVVTGSHGRVSEVAERVSALLKERKRRIEEREAEEKARREQREEREGAKADRAAAKGRKRRR